MNVFRSIFLQTALWRIAYAGSWGLVSLLSLKLMGRHLSLEIFGLVSVAILVIGCLPAMDGGFRTAINRRLLGSTSELQRAELMAFGPRFYTRFAMAALGAGVACMVLYSLTPNARSLKLPWAFYPALGCTGALVIIAYAYLTQLIGLGLQRRCFAIQAGMAWMYFGILWAGFRSGAGVWAVILAQGATQLLALSIAKPLVLMSSPGARAIDFEWNGSDRRLFRALWGEASDVMRMQLGTLILYVIDVVLVGWIWKGAAVAQYAVLASLFSKMTTLMKSADDAVWPILSAKGSKGEAISSGMARLNAWLYGSAMASAALCIPGFIEAYMGPGWSAGGLMAAVFAGRYLITGLAGQPAIWLYGHGHMRPLAGHVWRELLVGLALCVPLGLWLGPFGVAWAFLAATPAGMLLPLPADYAVRAGRGLGGMLLSFWSRAVLGACAAGALAGYALGRAGGWAQVLAVAIASTVAVIACALARAAWRARRAGGVDLESLARFI